jgi:VIT1/CCC1 family predicted Fe2+/Mn2+ transporter
MPTTPHIEAHFTSSAFVRDAVIGMSDGLTVPFALAAGLAGTVSATSIIVTAGFAEIAAGSIAMGLGGYLAAKTDAEHYATEKAREEWEVKEKPEAEVKEIEDIFAEYGLTTDEIAPITKAFNDRPKQWVDFMMRYELGMEKPDPRRALKSALTIGGAYILGGLIPLSPYILLSSAAKALIASIIITLLALAVFGYSKGRFTGMLPLRSLLQTTLIGGVSAAAAFVIARLVA